MNDVHPDEVVRLNRLEWDALPKDFRFVPRRFDWSMFDGYDPWNNPREKSSLRKGKARHLTAERKRAKP